LIQRSIFPVRHSSPHNRSHIRQLDVIPHPRGAGPRIDRAGPAARAIARKAGVCVRTVASALQPLKALGILNWVRRCAERRDADGRFVLEQETNAYAVLPESQWRGYRRPAEPPAPAAGTWGEPAPVLSALAQAALEVQALASDPRDGLAAALARLGRAFMARDS
jgi:hypothetical protein